MKSKKSILKRTIALALTLVLCLGLLPGASAAQENSYHDPAEHWQQALNRTDELDANAVVTNETFLPSTGSPSTPAPGRVPSTGVSDTQTVPL